MQMKNVTFSSKIKTQFEKTIQNFQSDNAKAYFYTSLNFFFSFSRYHTSIQFSTHPNKKACLSGTIVNANAFLKFWVYTIFIVYQFFLFHPQYWIVRYHILSCFQRNPYTMSLFECLAPFVLLMIFILVMINFFKSFYKSIKLSYTFFFTIFIFICIY